MTSEDYAARVQSTLRENPGVWAIIGEEPVDDFRELNPDMVLIADAINDGEGPWAPRGSFRSDVIGCPADGEEFTVPVCQLFACFVAPGTYADRDRVPSYRMPPEVEHEDPAEQDRALRELLSELQAAVTRNREWASNDTDATFRLQSAARAETYGYVVGRIQEILGDG